MIRKDIPVRKVFCQEQLFKLFECILLLSFNCIPRVSYVVQ